MATSRKFGGITQKGTKKLWAIEQHLTLILSENAKNKKKSYFLSFCPINALRTSPVNRIHMFLGLPDPAPFII
jgi:hypothetical protein